MKKVLALIIAIVLVAAVFAGCSAPEETEPVHADDVATEAGGKLDAIKEAGKLVMLTNASFPPYEYLGSDNKPAGVDVDIAQAVADELGVELEVVDMDFDGLIPALVANKGDIVAAGLTVTDERKESVDFSDTYANATQLIIIQEGSDKVKSVDDLAGKTIGVQLGTTGDIYASDIEGATVKQYKTGLEAAMDLNNGKLDAVVLDQLPAQNVVAVNDGLAIIDEPFTEEYYAIAVAKGNEDFLEVINSVVSKLYEDGTVAEWTEKHAQASAA